MILSEISDLGLLGQEPQVADRQAGDADEPHLALLLQALRRGERLVQDLLAGPELHVVDLEHEGGEVEAALLTHPMVREAVVDARGFGEEGTDKRLVAWIVPADTASVGSPGGADVSLVSSSSVAKPDVAALRAPP